MGVKQSIERYVEDIEGNYWSIVHNLGRDHFDEIMQQYHFKIDEYLPKINEELRGVVGMGRGELLRVDLKGVVGAVEGVEVVRRGKENEKDREREKEKERER